MNNGWKITPLLHRKPGAAEYVERMVKEIEALGIEKKPVTTVQAKSLAPIWDEAKNSLREMTEDEIIAYQSRPIPKMSDCLVNRDAEKINAELMLINPNRMHDSIVAEGLRRTAKNQMGDAISEGASSTTPESKERARQAFSYTPPTELTEAQKERLTEINLITAYEGPAIEEKLKKSNWFDIFKSKVRAGDNDNHISWRDIVHKDKK